MQPRPEGDDLDLHVLAAPVVILDHVLGVVEREVHDGRIILVYLNRKTVGLIFVRCLFGSWRLFLEESLVRHRSLSFRGYFWGRNMLKVLGVGGCCGNRAMRDPPSFESHFLGGCRGGRELTAPVSFRGEFGGRETT